MEGEGEREGWVRVRERGPDALQRESRACPMRQSREAQAGPSSDPLSYCSDTPHTNLTSSYSLGPSLGRERDIRTLSSSSALLSPSPNLLLASRQDGTRRPVSRCPRCPPRNQETTVLHFPRLSSIILPRSPGIQAKDIHRPRCISLKP